MAMDLKESNTGKRALKHSFSTIDTQIKTYQDKFEEINNAFHCKAIIHTEINVLRVYDNLENLSKSTIS